MPCGASVTRVHGNGKITALRSRPHRHAARLPAATPCRCDHARVDRHEVRERFVRHPPTDQGVTDSHRRISVGCESVAQYLITVIPPCRELDKAVELLEDAAMWANKGLARTQGYGHGE